MKRSLIPIVFVVIAYAFGCKKTSKTIEKNQQTTADSSKNSTPLTKTDVDNLLLQAYDLLDGVYVNQPGAIWATGTDNWDYGSVAAGESYKGSTAGDQPDAAAVATYTETGSTDYMGNKWQANITGITRANAVLKALPLVTDGSLSIADIQEVKAEARFLRGFYELEMAKLWRNVPYIDESGVTSGNAVPVWNKIEGDFAAAQASLPATQAHVGRPNKYAAEAFLAKTYMFDHKYQLAQPLLADLITSGITSNGAKYSLGHYANNFNPSTKFGPEGVFIIYAIVHDGTQGANGNPGDILNFPNGGPANCCGFFPPSMSFVNAFKTDPLTGLPMLDTYNNSNITNDMNVDYSSPFTPTNITLDSRLDWSVGRRGIPYLDWGNMPGSSWSRIQNEAGPYVPIKTVYYQAAQSTTADNYGGWAANEATSNGYNALRFADILLWAAEVEVEIGSLQKAENYVNQVRARAADPAGWVHQYLDPSQPLNGYSSNPAANYKVGLYGAAGGHPETGFAAGGQTYARKAVYFERLLELGQEGHRFFDLQRWDGRFGGPAGNGYMAQVINAYLSHEKNIPGLTSPLLKTANFVAGKNEVYPIPNAEVSNASSHLVQNPGY